MSFETITIQRTVPVIRRFVSIPNTMNDIPPVTDTDAKASITELTDIKFGVTYKMHFLGYTPLNPGEHADDWYQELKNI